MEMDDILDFDGHPWDSASKSTKTKNQQRVFGKNKAISAKQGPADTLSRSQNAGSKKSATQGRLERMEAARRRRELAAGILSSTASSEEEEDSFVNEEYGIHSSRTIHNNNIKKSTASERYEREATFESQPSIGYGVPTRDDRKRSTKGSSSFMEMFRQQSIVRSFANSDANGDSFGNLQTVRIHSRREKAFSPDNGGIWRARRDTKARDGLLVTTPAPTMDKNTNLYDPDSSEHEYLKTKSILRKLCMVLSCLGFLLVLGGAFVVYATVSGSKTLDENDASDSGPTPPITPPVDTFETGVGPDYFPPFKIVVAPGVVTTAMDPQLQQEADCNLADSVFPNIFDQCRCNDAISIIPEDVSKLYRDLVQALTPEFYGDGVFPQHAIESCDPRNLGLVWLATANNRRDPEGLKADVHGLRSRLLRRHLEDVYFDGELRQRYVLATFFASMGGSSWAERKNWMSTENECSWYGVECNEHGIIRSLILVENKLEGQVSSLSCVFTEIL